jgi:hypothetical protein
MLRIVRDRTNSSNGSRKSAANYEKHFSKVGHSFGFAGVYWGLFLWPTSGKPLFWLN